MLQVVRSGRTCLHHLLNAIKGALLEDIKWWVQYTEHVNGTDAFIQADHATVILTDTCPITSGAFCDGDFLYTQW